MKKLLFLAFSLVLFMSSCGGGSKSGQESNSGEVANVVEESADIVEAIADQITLTVASEQVDCTGVGPQKCFLIKQEGETDWSFWYSGIKDFNYESGYEYVIEVKVDTVASPPADASSINYTFVKEISKTQKQSENMPGVPVKK